MKMCEISQIVVNQKELKERINFIFYIAFSGRTSETICVKYKQQREKYTKKLRHLPKTRKVCSSEASFYRKDNSHFFVTFYQMKRNKHSLDEHVPVKLNEIELQTDNFYYHFKKHRASETMQTRAIEKQNTTYL